MSQQGKLDFKIFRRLVKYVRPYRKLLVAAFVCTVVLALITTARPMISGKIVNEFIINTQNPDALLRWMLLLLAMIFAEGVLQFLGTYTSNLLAQYIIRDIRHKLFRHISSFNMKYFDKTPIGTLVTRVISDIGAISEVFSSGLIDVLGDLLMLVCIVIAMFVVNWQLTLMTLIPIPLLLIATRIFAKAMRKSFHQESVQVNRLNTFVQERVTGMSIVQLFNREKKEQQQFEEINKQHRQAHINAVWAFSIFFPVVELLSSLSIAFLLVWGAFQFTGVQGGGPEIYGEIFAFTLWISMLFRPIRQLADKFNILQRGIVRAERVFEVIDLEEHVQSNGQLTKVDFDKDIHFQQVFFAYKDQDWILKNIDLDIPRGKTMAFVGATGAGKTSIVNLLGRFYEYEKGKILLGDVDLKDIELNTLRKNIAIVLQDVFLFSDTIHNNITLGDPEISREQVIEAAKAVSANEFIEKLPGGYDYVVGERGGVLSVGQRQLLAFIRAYVYNPHILILDEATSSVDNESEELIQRATDKLTEGRTSIVIAHRLSTIQKADRIVVLEKGEIMETGTHSELLQKDGYYRKLHDIQFS
ncbi:MAG: Xenobiotic-transporting ATPase [Crocinitomicaceae bacterium]|jgi:ATP-binding cassette subfamily B protein|nr:Xenobiotic-transporting ATPase [Crocinitomicaceae bacterium]